MIEYSKSSDYCYACCSRDRLEFSTAAQMDLAARRLDAVAWADANDVSSYRRRSGMVVAYIESRSDKGEGLTLTEAIEALRAKVEPTDEERIMSETKTTLDTGVLHEALVSKSAPDKRVPAELWECMLRFSRWLEWVSDDVSDLSAEIEGAKEAAVTPAELEACPDIVDEPATLHPTAQAVLDAFQWAKRGDVEVVKKDEGSYTVYWLENFQVEAMDVKADSRIEAMLEAHEAERSSPRQEMRTDLSTCELRPISDKDAATLEALNECRELGLCIQIHPDGSAAVGKSNNLLLMERGHFLPEALAAYKAAQAPQVKDGWYWIRFPRGQQEYLEVVGGKLKRWPSQEFEIVSEIGPECPPPPKGDE